MARRLKDLVSVGPATLGDFDVLGIKSVDQLASCEPQELYDRLCQLTQIQHDICCLDVFRAAVEQAKDPDLPTEQCQWWYWSKIRKQTSP